MKTTHLRLAMLAAGLALVAACGGSGGGIAANIASLGSTFQQAFAQGPNDGPIDISNADLALRLKQDPFEL